jgi:hypothetical protein
MLRLRSSAAVTVLALTLVALSQGCGEGEAREGPPFEPGNIENSDSLLITEGDIEEVGSATPYGTVLRWWRALQLAQVEEVQGSYADQISDRETQRQIQEFQPRFSQPVDPVVKMAGNRATVNVIVRTVLPLPATQKVIRVVDFPARFDLLRTAAGWKVLSSSYRNFIRARPFPSQPAG